MLSALDSDFSLNIGHYPGFKQPGPELEESLHNRRQARENAASKSRLTVLYLLVIGG